MKRWLSSRFLLLGLGSYRVSVERLEVEALVGDADVSRVTHQGEHHLCCTLHPRPLRHALKAAAHPSSHPTQTTNNK